jgi:hypothetical protein
LNVKIGPAYEEILGVDLTMLGQVVVLLSHKHSFTEEILVDLLAVGFGDKPGIVVSLHFIQG